MNTSIQTLSFQNFPVSFRADGYLNATEIAQSFGKVAKDYLKTERTQEYIAALIEFLSDGNKILSQSDLVIIKKGNSKNFTQGTWLHPKLAIDFARWLNPKFAVWCDMQIEKILHSNSASPKTQTALPDCLTLEQQDQIKKLHRQLVQAMPKEQQAKLAITLWSSIKSKFGVSYKKVPSEHYPEVLSLMARVAVERIETLHGEVLDKIPATPFSQTEFACHFVKLLNYARCYLRFQKLLCNDPNSPKAQELLNFFQYSVNVNQTGFLFVFKPDVENDIQKAADFIHHHFQQHDLPMI